MIKMFKPPSWCHCQKHNIDYPCRESCPICDKTVKLNRKEIIILPEKPPLEPLPTPIPTDYPDLNLNSTNYPDP